ncbi:MAG: hypothetical protein LBQ43_03040 [Holosporales bacterium]|jgi:hypothetical protein|nr:hypothetical protein [Holosporales bacterium]
MWYSAQFRSFLLADESLIIARVRYLFSKYGSGNDSRLWELFSPKPEEDIEYKAERTALNAILYKVIIEDKKEFWYEFFGACYSRPKSRSFYSRCIPDSWPQKNKWLKNALPTEYLTQEEINDPELFYTFIEDELEPFCSNDPYARQDSFIHNYSYGDIFAIDHTFRYKSLLAKLRNFLYVHPYETADRLNFLKERFGDFMHKISDSACREPNDMSHPIYEIIRQILCGRSELWNLIEEYIPNDCRTDKVYNKIILGLNGTYTRYTYYDKNYKVDASDRERFRPQFVKEPEPKRRGFWGFFSKR